MNFSPVNLVATLIGGLILAALLGWVRRARLIVQVPRLFSHSALTAKGQLAEISVFNRGFKTEEAIEVSLSPNLRYELVGSNSQEVTITGNKILIPRLGAGDDITALILVEAGTFSAADITNCLSKESKGTTVAKLEDVPPTGPQRVQLIAVFIVFPAIIYLAYLLITGYFKQEIQSVEKNILSSSNAEKKASSLEVVNGWTMMDVYVGANGPLFKLFKDGEVQVNVGTPVRKKDFVSVPVTLVNKSAVVISGTLTMKSARSFEKVPTYNLMKSGIVISPNSTVTTSISVVVPQGTTNEFDKKVYIEYFLKDAGEDSLQLKKTLVVE